MFDDAALAAHPQASAADLARIVSQRPDLRPVVATNPAAQPGLLDWLGSLGDPAVDAALARRRAGQPVAPAPMVSGRTVFLPDGDPWTGPATSSSAASDWSGQVTTVQEPIIQHYTGAAPRSRKRLWIGLAVAAVLVVGLGAAAAWILVLSKLGGAATPEAAVTQLVEGAAHKDGIAVYGALSPEETSSFGDVLGSFSELSGASSQEVAADDLRDVLDALDVDLTGLSVHSESIGDGLAKVTIDGGTLTVDGDGKTIADALARAYGPVLAAQGLSSAQTDEQWAAAAQQIDAGLPWSVSAADLTWHTDRGDAQPFLVAVREGGSWYVSPMMTLGEYANVAQGGPARGAMPTGKGAPSDSPEAAGAAFATAIGQLVGGDAGPLADTLPPAERRFVSVYAQGWLDAAKSSTGTAHVTVDHPAFGVTSIDPDHARLSAQGIVVDVTGTGADDATVTIDGACATDGSANGKICLGDSALGKQLGWDQLGLVAVKGDGGWRVSALSTFADWGTLTASHVRALKASGELDDGELLQKLLSEGVAASGGGGLPSVLGESDDLGTDDLGVDGSVDSMNGYTFDDDGNLLDPSGEPVEGWSFDDDGNLVDAEGTVLATF